MSKIEQNIGLEEWVNLLLSKGQSAFSLVQLKKELSMTDIAIKRSLNRLTKKGNILSIHKGYYIIIEPQYRSWGILPPSLFIDGLMKYLERPYYIALLSAAEIHGAAHQKPQEYYVIIEAPVLRPIEKKSLKLNYIIKSSIPKNLLVQVKTETGYVQVSSPELTAIDLFQYEKRVGGLNRVGTVLNELIEEFSLERISEELIKATKAAHIQRLGYMLEFIVDGKEFADKLYSESQNLNIHFTRLALQKNTSIKEYSSKNRWNIIVNTEIEIDE